MHKLHLLGTDFDDSNMGKLSLFLRAWDEVSGITDVCVYASEQKPDSKRQVVAVAENVQNY